MSIKLHRFQQSAPADSTYKFHPALLSFWQKANPPPQKTPTQSKHKGSLVLTEFRFKAKDASKNLPLSKHLINNSVSRSDETWRRIRRRHGSSELLTAPSVAYRSQMGRGAGVKCIKCPLLSFMNGLKDLQSSVMRPSITVTALLIFMALAAAEASGAVVSTSSASFVKSFTSASTPENSHGDEGRTRRPFPRRTRTPS